MHFNETSRRIYAKGFASRQWHRESDVGERNAKQGRGLNKRSVHGWHGLAAILAMMTV